jgi:hypothetical protein
MAIPRWASESAGNGAQPVVGGDTRLRGRPELSGHSGRARPAIRPHLPIHKDAPLSEFEQVSSQFPVFRVVPRSAEHGLPLDAHKDARR